MNTTHISAKGRRPFIGGQAVIEGVMFRSPHAYAVAVRNPAGEIVTEAREHASLTSKSPWRLPFIRGAVALYESLALGYKALMFSAEIAEPRKEGEERKKASFWEKAGLVAFSLAFGLLLFVGVPYGVAYLLKGPLGVTAEGSVVFNLVDGLLRVVVFLGYLLAISMLKDIRRMFAYHGAEHKVINTYEHGREPRAENVPAASRFHPRCGTSFIIVLLLILIVFHSVVFTLLPADLNFLTKLLVRLALIIPIAGVAYELIRLGSRFPDNKIINFFLLPGMLTQYLTTREPDGDMVEVALSSFRRVREEEDAAGGPREAGD
ncbi:MAG TPA: DUF1385 domain-containing protein [bacterium]|nr:DUF1385 domain-containing protein [bacterium]